MNNDRLAVFAEFTANLAKLSKCRERAVAAIIVDKSMSQVYSIGVNGGPKGLADCMCGMSHKYGCVHAEVNALVKCRSNEPGKVMIVTLSPCVACAAAIINAPGGFSAVYYIEQWKDSKGIELLKNAGIKCVGLTGIKLPETHRKSVDSNSTNFISDITNAQEVI